MGCGAGNNPCRTRPGRLALVGNYTVRVFKVDPANPFRFILRFKPMSSGGWLRVLAFAALGLTVAALFVHLVIAIAVGVLFVVLLRSAAQNLLGPGVRIRFRLPPTLSARLKAWMWRR